MSTTQLRSRGGPASRIASPFGCWCAVADAATLITVTGELDISTAPMLEARLRSELLRAPLVVLDLRAVEFVDLTSARMIVNFDGRIRQAGGRLVIVPASVEVRSLFTLIGADADLELVDRPSNALAASGTVGALAASGGSFAADADDLSQALRGAGRVGIDPRRVLLALGFRLHEPLAMSGGRSH